MKASLSYIGVTCIWFVLFVPSVMCTMSLGTLDSLVSGAGYIAILLPWLGALVFLLRERSFYLRRC